MSDQPEIPCSGAVLKRAHDAHYWRPERSMGPVYCPGHQQPEPGEWFPTGVVLAPGDEDGPWPACNEYKQATDHATEDPLAAFRALADQYAAEAAKTERNAEYSVTRQARMAQQGIAAGWKHAEYLLRHTIDGLDNSRTTPDNPEPAERCGHLSPRMLGRAPVECVLRPGHNGSHANEKGARWQWTGPGPEQWAVSAIDEAFAARDAELERLRAQLAALAAIARGYCPHCGRGDAAPTADMYLEQVQRADNAEVDLADARMWARHGYEIGQRHCGWADHGVAPSWLTDDWPLHFDDCEHLKRAAEIDLRLARVRAIHTPVDTMAGRVCEGCMNCDPYEALPWPCRTIEALTGEETPS